MTARPLICFALIVLSFQNAFSQTPARRVKARDFHEDSYNSTFITLGKEEMDQIELTGFRKIKIVDARPDTLTIGFTRRDRTDKIEKIQFRTFNLSEVESYTNKITKLNADAKTDLLIIVKQLWLRNDVFDEEHLRDYSNSRRARYEESEIQGKFEFYIKQGTQCYPLTRFDTVIRRAMPLNEYMAEHVEDFIYASISKVNRMDVATTMQKRKPVTMDTITKFDQQRFKYAIFTGDPKKGVYQNFKQFLNNQPAFENYDMETRGDLDELSVQMPSGNMQPISNAWGYCDGTTIFIAHHSNFYPLTRIQNAFYFIGPKKVHDTRNTRETSGSNMDLKGRTNTAPPPQPGYGYYNPSAPHLVREKINVMYPLKIDIEKGTVL